MAHGAMIGPQAAMVGRRLHLQHGPIDLIVYAAGAPDEVAAAYSQAREGFDGVLEGVAGDLFLLRRDVNDVQTDAQTLNPVSERMIAAVRGSRDFVTPMAAVAGAVADHVMRAMVAGRILSRAIVNNGGDISLQLMDGTSCVVGLMQGDVVVPVTIAASDGIGGVATSGWSGRSHSLGIADFVTVFARDAARADVAATLLANAVDLPKNPRIERTPANALSPDSDLGPRLVTTAVPILTPVECTEALENGRQRATQMVEDGVIVFARLGLQGHFIDIGALPAGAVYSHDEGRHHRERHRA